MQSTASRQMPMNIQLVKLKDQLASALKAANGRLRRRPRCESTSSVPAIAAMPAIAKTRRLLSHTFRKSAMPERPTNQRKKAIVHAQWLVAA